jgi:hypothetical protein
MAKAKRKQKVEEAGAEGVEAAYALWGKGDFKSARTMARGLLAASPADGDRVLLQRLLDDTSPDPRAAQIAVFCLAVVVMVVVLAKLFG